MLLPTSEPTPKPVVGGTPTPKPLSYPPNKLGKLGSILLILVEQDLTNFE